MLLNVFLMLICSQKGEAYSRRFVRLSGTLSGEKLYSYCWHLNETWFIDRWQWREG